MAYCEGGILFCFFSCFPLLRFPQTSSSVKLATPNTRNKSNTLRLLLTPTDKWDEFANARTRTQSYIRGAGWLLRLTFRLTDLASSSSSKVCVCLCFGCAVTSLLITIGVVGFAVVVVVTVCYWFGCLLLLSGTNGNYTPFQNNSDDGDQILLASLFQW